MSCPRTCSGHVRLQINCTNIGPAPKVLYCKGLNTSGRQIGGFLEEIKGLSEEEVLSTKSSQTWWLLWWDNSYVAGAAQPPVPHTFHRQCRYIGRLTGAHTFSLSTAAGDFSLSLSSSHCAVSERHTHRQQLILLPPLLPHWQGTEPMGLQHRRNKASWDM